jgi:hypothetical protein
VRRQLPFSSFYNDHEALRWPAEQVQEYAVDRKTPLMLYHTDFGSQAATPTPSSPRLLRLLTPQKRMLPVVFGYSANQLPMQTATKKSFIFQ